MDNDTRSLINNITWLVAGFLSFIIMSVAGVVYYVHQHGLKYVIEVIWYGVGK